MKKTIIITSVLLCLIIATIYYCGGYKIPQKDKHENWTTLENNSDKLFKIDTIGYVSTLVYLDFDNLYLYGCGRNIYLMKNNGRKLKSFNENDNITIDFLHKRIISKKTIYIDTLKTEKYISYNLKTLDSTSVEIIKFPLKETYQDYLKRKNIIIKNISGQEEDHNRQDSIYTNLYLAEHKEFSDFVNQLYPLVEISSTQDSSNITFYTDKKGNVFDINLKDKETGYSDYTDSMNKLWPNWNKQLEGKESANIKPETNISIADKPCIIGNIFNFDSDIIPSFDPKGGTNNHNNEMNFDQKFINYFEIRFKKSKLNFKETQNYQTQDVSSFTQLNIPESDNDTIAIIHKDRLYCIYKKSKLNLKKNISRDKLK